MAERDTAEKVMSEAITSDLYEKLTQAFEQAIGVDIIVSFLMESGTKMLLADLKKAINGNIPIRILTGSYMGITQPAALVMLKEELQGRADIRLYKETAISFHPKAYIFHYIDHNEIFVGSSNVSRSALTEGIEWNYRFTDIQDRHAYHHFQQVFEDLFENHSITADDEVIHQYALNWHATAVYKAFKAEDKPAGTEILSPRDFQIEALYALRKTRAEGAERAMVKAATGTGKTYLAAFDSLGFKRVLFAAHREELLLQAQRSFSKVRNANTSGLFIGDTRETNRDMIFASVASLSRHLDMFRPDAFDYMVVDEFHHAAADSYQKILAYFKPEFLLGLTATPDRMDGKSIYEICDYNVAYEINTSDAINRDILCPFHYYGIYDEMDYSGIRYSNGHYDEQELTQAYIQNEKRMNLVLRHYRKYSSQKALGFCSSRKHAEEMAAFFNRNGIRSAVVVSGGAENRNDVLKQFENGKTNVLFSVNMFNEGLDIPNVDMILFLRPTESQIVFSQQLGRGLRKADGKEYVNVLDFIGNYRNANKIPKYLMNQNAPAAGITIPAAVDLPDGCFIDFDLELIDLFREMEKAGKTIFNRIKDEYLDIRRNLGKVPDRCELFSYMSDEIYELCKTPQNNPFNDYLAFLDKMGDLNEERSRLLTTDAGRFIHLLETTVMSRSYKMPLLQSFIQKTEILNSVDETRALETWKKFYKTGDNWKDIGGVKTYADFQSISDRKHLSNIVKNPAHFLIQSGEGFFIGKENTVLALDERLLSYLKDPVFIREYTDTVNFRVQEYYYKKYKNKFRH